MILLEITLFVGVLVCVHSSAVGGEGGGIGAEMVGG